MLYDEEGRPYVEPPLLPEERHLMYIVKDYARMYRENQALQNRNERLRDSLRRGNGYQYALNRIIIEQERQIVRLIKMLENRGATVPRDILDYQAVKYSKRYK